MKLSLTCDHGTWTVEFDEGREGIGNPRPAPGGDSYVAQLIEASMPRCPYCDVPWRRPS